MTKSEESFDAMENQMIEGEPQETPQTETGSKFKIPKVNVGNIKNFLLNFKKPKLATILILLGTIIVISVALVLVQSRKQEQNQPIIPTPQPSVQASSDLSKENISKLVTIYNRKIDNLQDYQKTLEKPIVDLDISFEK